MNELAMIFNKLNIDTLDVIEAASTKWNFLDFKPGLVGGHCIGVDPYYLTYISEKNGYIPKIVTTGREINDNFGEWITKEFLLECDRREINKNTDILIMGLSFKEDCPDIRNTKVLDILSYLKKSNLNFTITDPIIDSEEAYKKYKMVVFNKIPEKNFH